MPRLTAPPAPGNARMPDLIEPDLIEKEQPVPAAQAATRACDPVTLEIVRGAIRAAQAEMEALIERAAISAFIREKKDFYTALFDADGVLPPGSGARPRERLAVHFASGTAEVAAVRPRVLGRRRSHRRTGHPLSARRHDAGPARLDGRRPSLRRDPPDALKP